MKYRKLGDTGLLVSEVSFGTIPILSGNAKVLPEYFCPDEDEAIKIMEYAYRLGCNFYDTAIVPEYGDAEIKLGKFAKYIGRKNIIISSKARYYNGNDMYRAVNESYRNLGTNMDIYFVHQINFESEDSTFEKYGAVDALTQLKKEGKIRYVGVASHYYNILLHGAKDKRVDVLQCSGNILERGMLDRIKGEKAFEHKGIIVNKVFAAGILPKFFNIHTLINNVLTYPISTALIGLGTIEQVKQSMKYESKVKHLTFSNVISKLENSFTPIKCDRCQRCYCKHGIEIHVLFRQFNYYYLGKDFWALRKLNLNIHECAEKCKQCTDMICIDSCPKKLNIPKKIQQIRDFVDRH